MESRQITQPLVAYKKAMQALAGPVSNKSLATNHLTQLPLYSGQEAQGIHDGFGVPNAFNPYYSEDRTARHVTAQMAGAGLYHYGAMLINNATAYSQKLAQSLHLPSTLSTGAIVASGNGAPNNDIKQDLLDVYNAIPKITVWNGSRHCAQNPLQAVFVMKVALDHLAPNAIWKVYQKLSANSREMTINFATVDFPNGSQLLNDHAVQTVIFQYMINNPDRFEPYKEQIEESKTWLLDEVFNIMGNKCSSLGQVKMATNQLGAASNQLGHSAPLFLVDSDSPEQQIKLLNHLLTDCFSNALAVEALPVPDSQHSNQVGSPFVAEDLLAEKEGDGEKQGLSSSGSDDELTPLLGEDPLLPLPQVNKDRRLELASKGIEKLILELRSETACSGFIRFFTDFHGTKKAKLDALESLQALIGAGVRYKDLCAQAKEYLKDPAVAHTSWPLQSRTARLLSELVELNDPQVAASRLF